MTLRRAQDERLRLPVLPTLLVLVAVGVMIRLGFWQLDRLQQKGALLAKYRGAEALSAEVAWPNGANGADAVLYRRSRVDCAAVTEATSVSGQSAQGEAGIAHVAVCSLRGGGTAWVVLGWSRDPKVPDWNGGEVTGMIAPGGKQGPRLVADPPLAGLEANARPDPADVPNNHLSYAIQWFFFAGAALVIYALALRKRLAEGRNRR